MKRPVFDGRKFHPGAHPKWRPNKKHEQKNLQKIEKQQYEISFFSTAADGRPSTIMVMQIGPFLLSMIIDTTFVCNSKTPIFFRPLSLSLTKRPHSPPSILTPAISVMSSNKRMQPSSSSSSCHEGKRSKTQQSLTGFFTAGKKHHDDGGKNMSAVTNSVTTPKVTTTSPMSATTSSSALLASSPKPLSPYKIFCDLDGVLVDFEAGIKKLFNGRSPDQLPNQGMMWGAISKTPDFYSTLPWTSDGQLLWEELRSLTPDILTGVPRLNRSRAEKFEWCRKELGVKVNHLDMAGKKNTHEVVLGRRKEGVVNVITCWSKNKHFESRENQLSRNILCCVVIGLVVNYIHVWIIYFLVTVF